MSRETASLLLVEDDRVARAVLVDALTTAGYSVSTAATRAAAASLISGDAHFDVAVVDIILPDGHGTGLGPDLVACGTPFVMLTAYTDAALVDAAVASGSAAYLVKPVSLEQLLPTLLSVTARASEQARLRHANQQLSEALAQGREVSVVVGILMERFQLDHRAAFESLRREARARRVRLVELAHELLGAEERLHGVQARGKGSGPGDHG